MVMEEIGAHTSSKEALAFIFYPYHLKKKIVFKRTSIKCMIKLTSMNGVVQ